MDAYSASLLPYQKTNYIKSTIDQLHYQIYGLENEDAIEAVEEMAKKRLLEIRERKKKR